MSFRIGEWVLRGEVDCRVRGKITGKLWLTGRKDPLRFDLSGIPERDLAGCVLKFKCGEVQTGGKIPMGLVSEQPGRAGTVTASRKVRVPTIPTEEWQACLAEKRPFPSQWKKAIYLEWFGETNGRVVVEIAGAHCELSLPEWTLESEESAARCEEESMEWDIGDAMDEFEWEKKLKESDTTADRLMELIDLHGHSDEAWDKIEEEMGWEDDFAEDGDDPGIVDEEEAFEEEAMLEQLGKIRHPLVKRTQNLGLRLSAQDPTTPPQPPTRCEEAAEKIWLVSAKLAGALTRPEHFEPGFVVATLKRSLALWNEATPAIELCSADSEIIPEILADWLACRSEIVDLMNEYRQKR
jgi:hypothetical protein